MVCTRQQKFFEACQQSNLQDLKQLESEIQAFFAKVQNQTLLGHIPDSNAASASKRI